MPKKIVIKVQISCDKCRTKALKIAAETEGVNSVAIQGADKDEVVVTGDDIDSATLTCKLRKRLRYANIVSVQEEKPKAPPQPPPKKPEPKPEPPPICYPTPPCYGVIVCDPNPSPCSLM